MRALMIACALALALPTAGCAQLPDWLPRNDRGVLEGQKLDEQALGLAYAGATLANIAIANLPPGVLTRDQLLEVKRLKGVVDKGLPAAQAAYDAGDAKTYREKIAAVRVAIDRITALVPKEPAR